MACRKGAPRSPLVVPVHESHVTIELVPTADIDLQAVAALVNSAFARHTIRTVPRTSPESLLDEAGGDGEFLLARKGTRLVGSALVRSATSVFRANTVTDLDLATALYFG